MADAPPVRTARVIERIAHKARDFETADRWDRQQHLDLSPQERLRAARVLKDRAFSPDAPDVRACRKTG